MLATGLNPIFNFQFKVSVVLIKIEWTYQYQEYWPSFIKSHLKWQYQAYWLCWITSHLKSSMTRVKVECG